MATEAPMTYWRYTIYVDGYAGKRGVVCDSSSTLGDMLSRAIAHAVYYQATYPGKRVTIGDIREMCFICHNEGRARGVTGLGRLARCWHCKGKVPTGRVDDVVFCMPDPANNIRLTCTDPAEYTPAKEDVTEE